MRSFTVPAVLAAAAVLGTAAASANENTGKRFRVALEGAVEVPVAGDPDGTGTAVLRINPGQGQLCYTLTVSGIAPATAAHIHEAPAGSAGPVVVGLAAPTSGSSSGCVSIDREEARDIIRNPENYYVNVHNREFPGGALRGQLG
ncbi:MAG TPA: CHRD domain-containing protein [Sphingomicrobium sp.]|nr:CHRD domain-containing protein [Sphingomicrobium sp.]